MIPRWVPSSPMPPQILEAQPAIVPTLREEEARSRSHLQYWMGKDDDYKMQKSWIVF